LHDEITAIPRIGPSLVKLLNTLNSSNSNKGSNIEELELLIEELQKCGGVKAFRENLSKLNEHHEEGIRRSGRKGEGDEVEEKGNNKCNGEDEKIDDYEQKGEGGEQTILIMTTQQRSNNNFF
jgi:hypothetical protein